MFENKLSASPQPVLQILESRYLNGPQPTVRLSDGVFSYSGCGIVTDLANRFKDDGLLDSNGIIRVLDFSVTTRG